MEAHQRTEVTSVLAGNVELGSGAQRAGGWRVEVTGVLVAGNAWSWAAAHRGPGGGGMDSGGAARVM